MKKSIAGWIKIVRHNIATNTETTVSAYRDTQSNVEYLRVELVRLNTSCPPGTQYYAV